MGYKRNKSNRDNAGEFLDMLMSMTGVFWQIGIVITLVLVLLTVKALFYVAGLEQTLTSNNATAIFESFFWLYYLIPVMPLILALIFGRLTYLSYLRQS